METIQMVDLKRRYARLKSEIDKATTDVMAAGSFIGGPEVDSFTRELGQYLNAPHIIPCANGTDALELALRALGVQPGDEVIMPAFTYIAAAEMVALLGATPVLIDVRPDTYNIDSALVEQAVSRQTKAIVVVHLFGQTCDMDPILRVAKKYKLGVIEDNAQSLGADYISSDGRTRKAGTIAHIGTTSFFPTKPLACYGDGGAVFTADSQLAERIRCLANHGQAAKYDHRAIGRNSRLDALQAAILRVNLRHMDDDIAAPWPTVTTRVSARCLGCASPPGRSSPRTSSTSTPSASPTAAVMPSAKPYVRRASPRWSTTRAPSTSKKPTNGSPGPAAAWPNPSASPTTSSRCPSTPR